MNPEETKVADDVLFTRRDSELSEYLLISK